VGLFDFPRIHFSGTHEVNPGTGNNNSASPGEELTVTSDSERVEAVEFPGSDAEFRRWMLELDPLGVLRSQWNYYGDMSFRFTGVTVRSVQLAPDRLLRTWAEDKLVGASVHLNNAIVCDNNPEGFNGTQVFAEALEIHALGALQGAGSFISRPPDRATTRWLNWHRNVSFQTPFQVPDPEKPATGAAAKRRRPTVTRNSRASECSGELTSGAAGGASATFQCGIEIRKEDLRADLGDHRVLARSRFKLLPAAGSESLHALVAAIERGARGVILRYNLYLTYPRISDTELAQRFQRGERACNPAVGRLVGTLAPWFDGEPSTITLGRLLKPAKAYPNAYRPNKPYYLSPAVAVQNSQTKHIAIDLANCLPEDGPEGDKYNLGLVTLGVRAATEPERDPATNDAEVTPIATLDNVRETYLDRGGIYDVSYANLSDQGALLDDHGYELVLSSSLYGVLLYEPEFMLASDCTCNYLDELAPGQTWSDPSVQAELRKQPHPALQGKVDLRLLRRGKPPTKPVTVNVEEWRQTPTGFPGNYGVYRYPALLQRRTFAMKEQAEFELAPSRGSGLRIYRFVPERNWPQDIDERAIANHAIRESIIEVRVLPYEDFSQVRDDELTLELIYQKIFRYYDLITPAMSEAMDLKDPSIWEMPAAARYVLLTSSLDLWSSWQFMPRTRDLSRARRELLHRFCRAVLRRNELRGK
jgi:hypothetical protein